MFGRMRKNKSLPMRKNTSLTIRDKLRLIERYENGLNARQLQQEFQCGKTQVYETLKRRVEIRRQYSDESIQGRELCQVVNGVVWDWVLEANSNNLPITGEKLKERARSVAEKLGNSEFRPTNDWLSSFRTKHNLVWSNSSDIVGDGDQELLHVDHDMEILPNTPLSVEIEDLDSTATSTNTIQMTFAPESLQNDLSEQSSAVLHHRNQLQDDDRLPNCFRANYGTGHTFDAECEESVCEIPAKKSPEELAHDHFIRFVDNTLQSIGSSYKKDMAKLEIQQVLIKYKHSVDVAQPTAAYLPNSDHAVSSS